MMWRRVFSFVVLLFVLSGCVSLVAPYDPEFDTTLNALSENTAKFLADAEAGFSARNANSREAVQYYAVSYNTLDRLSQRAARSRGAACPNNADLKAFADQPTSQSPLPSDYMRFDCLEAQLFYVRFYLDQLHYAQDQGGTLNSSEATALGGALQTAISGAIQTFLETKP